jgi:branched-chain amino acid transport system substrate-binding protein
MKKVLLLGLCFGLVMAMGSVGWAQPKELKLGLLAPLTGPISEGGQRIANSIKLAAEEINAKGGLLGMQIKLIEWDTQGEPERGVTGAKKLIDSDQVWGLIGVYRSGVALAVAEIAVANKKLFMVTDAASPAVTGLVQKDYDKYKYIFRTAAMATQFTISVNPFVTDIIKAKTYFFIAENTKMSRDIFEATKKTFDPMGIQCLGEAYVDVAASEFMGELARIKSLKPDVVIIHIPAAGGVAFQKQYYDSKVGIPHIAHTGVMNMPNVVREVGQKSDYASFAAFCWNVPITDKTVPFYKKFTKKFGYEPEGYSDVRSYDGMLVLADGIKRAGSLDVEKVIKALEKTDLKGVAGRYVFDETHQARWGEGYLLNIIGEWVNGKGYVLWPKAYANGTYKHDPRK